MSKDTDFKEGDEVHAVRISDDSYVVSQTFADEIKKQSKKSEKIGSYLGVDIIVSDTLPYIYHEAESE